MALAILAFPFTFTTLTVIDDIDTYYTNVNKSGCCGWVSENVLERPFTYLMVDRWSEPKWSLNATATEVWLTVDGYVDSERHFWRILDKREPTKG